jgi:hypothetical protein
MWEVCEQLCCWTNVWYLGALERVYRNTCAAVTKQTPQNNDPSFILQKTFPLASAKLYCQGQQYVWIIPTLVENYLVSNLHHALQIEAEESELTMRLSGPQTVNGLTLSSVGEGRIWLTSCWSIRNWYTNESSKSNSGSYSTWRLSDMPHNYKSLTFIFTHGVLMRSCLQSRRLLEERSRMYFREIWSQV